MGTHDLRLRLAQVSEREGRRHEAACLYAQVLWGNHYQVEAWWGLSQTVGDPDRALYCLKRVLALDPGHTKARQRLNQRALEVMSDSLQDGPALRTIVASLNKPIFN